jgi:hypothetical protein
VFIAHCEGERKLVFGEGLDWGRRAKGLGHRSGEAETDEVVAGAGNVVAAKSRPHEPGVAVTGTAAINPGRACRWSCGVCTT